MQELKNFRFSNEALYVNSKERCKAPSQFLNNDGAIIFRYYVVVNTCIAA